jgi:branched-chain amino acid transport system ATP-binding protein
MLAANDLNVFYGGIQATRDVSIRVPAGQLVTIIGANGAGKSTLLKTLAGLVQPRSGSIALEAQDITHTLAHQRAKMGMVLVPEGRRIFKAFTVYENLMMGVYGLRDRTHALRSRLQTLYQLFPILQERADQLGGTLSGGEQQMLAIARALASSPKLLMLDEPSMGLAPIYQEGVRGILLKLKAEGITILLVEQNAALAMAVADYIYLLRVGSIMEEGPSSIMTHSAHVREAYLGG